ncbi:Putative transcription factor Jun, basic-leucine zipper domain-containing protein [Colletotrichum destructivum]|uniref:Transcription factor Jun, basic-leucine zipper domain-containing protein n=1 Tax=Colletotrichum destructivum TaxID=34406 RepID=A0AAX4IZR4_9PEZI|nr:Putative transcription factor Jun, basic-leucine zipper domain-containing protein [Colletotrichum destructivum]
MGTSPNDASTRGDTKSPKQSNNATPPRQDSIPEVKQPDPSLKPDADGAKPLGPPPRPGQTTGNTPDYFGGGAAGSLSLEPNPFEQSFGGGAPETPGGTKLPSVAALTSPSSLLPGSGATPFNWGGGSLRTGPLSPAMLSGPTSDYFSDSHHLRGGFPTPNESSLRTGLTPGGSGSMFPAPSPNSQQLFAQLASGGATPSTIDFHRTALSAAAKRENQNQNQSQQQPAVTSQPQDMPNGAPTVKAEAKQFDPHDNDAANGLFMLAQGRNGAQAPVYATTTQPQPQSQAQTQTQTQSQSQPQPHPAAAPSKRIDTSPQMSVNGAGSVGAGSSVRGVSEGGSAMSDESEQARPSARGKGKRNSTGGASTNGRRKAEEPLAKGPPSKKSKPNNAPPPDMNGDDSHSDDDDDMKHENGEGGSKSKMTDEEKRKNFLERNRVAALKCRQRKKQWLANLQSKVELFSSENDALTAQITQLREEVVNLKTLLLAHKDCPVTQQQGLHGAFMQQAMEPFNPQMNPYGMAAPMSNQQVLAAGQGVQRRFS